MGKRGKAHIAGLELADIVGHCKLKIAVAIGNGLVVAIVVDHSPGQRSALLVEHIALDSPVGCPYTGPDHIEKDYQC